MPGVEVRRILQMQPEAHNGSLIQEFAAGNKRIRVILYPEIHSASTRIENTSPDHTPGATTALYERAREVMQSFATASGRPIEYTFLTRVDSMRTWAMLQNGGEKVFDWDDFPMEEHGFFIAKKTFHPQEQ